MITEYKVQRKVDGVWEDFAVSKSYKRLDFATAHEISSTAAMRFPDSDFRVVKRTVSDWEVDYV